ncbi:MAG: hypothetical protein H7201_09000 [Candidatus Saccharibacteria bacterium]|nr:hypothetical protein [Microbacteriaceae bacterium]
MMNISSRAGHTDLEVPAITRRYEGRSFSGMTNGYDKGLALVAFGAALP